MGCLFHMKYNVRKMMLSDKCGFPRELVHKLMQADGPFDVLLRAPEDEMERALAYFRSKIDTETYPTAKVDVFMAYFKKTWLRLYKHGDWSWEPLAKRAEAGELTEQDAVCTCNNPLEKTNRDVNDLFQTTPQMDLFVSTLKVFSTGKLRDIERVQRGDLPVPVRAPPRFPAFPADWASFVIPAPVPVGPVAPQGLLPPTPFAPFADPVAEPRLALSPLPPPPQPQPAARLDGDADGAALVPAGLRTPRQPLVYIPRPSARRALGTVPEGDER